MWDFAFYGNKLFQSTFIGIITGGHASLITTLEWTLLNSAVALVGYYFAAFTVDCRWMGRKRMQVGESLPAAPTASQQPSMQKTYVAESLI